jgi:hypothetical protein
MPVYMIQAGEGGPVKIGVASILKKRLEALKVSSPVPLTVLAAFDGGDELEKKLHRHFDAARLEGEWFRPVPELLAHAKLGADAVPAALAQRKLSPAQIEEREAALRRPGPVINESRDAERYQAPQHIREATELMLECRRLALLAPFMAPRVQAVIRAGLPRVAAAFAEVAAAFAEKEEGADEGLACPSPALPARWGQMELELEEAA